MYKICRRLRNLKVGSLHRLSVDTSWISRLRHRTYAIDKTFFRTRKQLPNPPSRPAAVLFPSQQPPPPPPPCLSRLCPMWVGGAPAVAAPASSRQPSGRTWLRSWQASLASCPPSPQRRPRRQGRGSRSSPATPTPSLRLCGRRRRPARLWMKTMRPTHRRAG